MNVQHNQTLFFPLLPDQPGKSETYLEAIRKNIEWLKKHNKDEGKDGETLSPLSCSPFSSLLLEFQETSSLANTRLFTSLWWVTDSSEATN